MKKLIGVVLSFIVVCSLATYSSADFTSLVGKHVWVCSSLATDIAAISTTKTTLVIKDTQTLASSVEIPSTVVVRFERGGSVVLGDYNLTIAGPIEAGRFQIFNCSGSGAVSFTDNYCIAEAFPEWWGAIADGSTNCATALNAALTAAQTVTCADGIYALAAGITIPRGHQLLGVSAGWRYYPEIVTPNKGTIFSVANWAYDGNYLPAAVTMKCDSALRGVSFTYPTQVITGTPTHFPWTISTYDSEAQTLGAQISNVTAHNADKFIWAYGDAFRFNDIDATVARYGLYHERYGDICYFNNIRIHPINTWAESGVWDWTHDNGTAFYFGSIGSTSGWTSVSNCFTIGFKIGYHIDDANSVTLHNCGADDSGTGFYILGTNVQLVNCRAVGSDYSGVTEVCHGVYLGSASAQTSHVIIDGLSTWQNTGAGVYIRNARDTTINNIMVYGWNICTTPSSYGAIHVASDATGAEVQGLVISNGNFVTTGSTMTAGTPSGVYIAGAAQYCSVTGCCFRGVTALTDYGIRGTPTVGTSAIQEGNVFILVDTPISGTWTNSDFDAFSFGDKSGDQTLTFDSTTDGTITWDVSELDFEVNYHLTAKGGHIYAGVDDTTRGILTAYGPSSDAQGGSLVLYLSAAYDTPETAEAWYIMPNEDDLVFTNDDSKYMQLYGDSGNLYVLGSVSGCDILDRGTCDFVFEKGYRLPSIDEVKKSVVTTNKLPGLLKPDVISMKDLMIKTEEQALYIIQLHERLEALEAKLAK